MAEFGARAVWTKPRQSNAIGEPARHLDPDLGQFPLAPSLWLRMHVSICRISRRDVNSI